MEHAQPQRCQRAPSPEDTRPAPPDLWSQRSLVRPNELDPSPPPPQVPEMHNRGSINRPWSDAGPVTRGTGTDKPQAITATTQTCYSGLHDHRHHTNLLQWTDHCHHTDLLQWTLSPARLPPPPPPSHTHTHRQRQRQRERRIRFCKVPRECFTKTLTNTDWAVAHSTASPQQSEICMGSATCVMHGRPGIKPSTYISHAHTLYSIPCTVYPDTLHSIP